jgi:hypothetical protein
MAPLLAAVLADAGRIAFDVAGIVCGIAEGRGEQQRQLVIPAYQIFVERRHGARRVGRFAGARDDGPGLRDRIDPAFAVGD